MNVQVNQNERLIRPSDPAIRYTGRIDNSNPDAPFLIYVCSQVEFRVTGHVLRVFIENIHSFMKIGWASSSTGWNPPCCWKAAHR